ncbi:hypothetical protein D3C73_724930 [compost metagenome]
MHHAHIGWPLRVDGIGHHFGDEAGTAGAGEQHALVRVIEAVAEEGLQAVAGTRQILCKGFPQRRLLGDFGSGIGSAEALPGGHIGKQGDVHSEVPVGPAHHLRFLSKCQIPKVKRKILRCRLSRCGRPPETKETARCRIAQCLTGGCKRLHKVLRRNNFRFI